MPDRDMGTQLLQERRREAWRRGLAAAERKLGGRNAEMAALEAEAYRRAIDRYDRGDDFSQVVDDLRADMLAAFGRDGAIPKVPVSAGW
jgi:hypothetical protein